MHKIFQVRKIHISDDEPVSKIVKSFYLAERIEQVWSALKNDLADESIEILEISQVIDSVKNVSDFL